MSLWLWSRTLRTTGMPLRPAELLLNSSSSSLSPPRTSRRPEYMLVLVPRPKCCPCSNTTKHTRTVRREGREQGVTDLPSGSLHLHNFSVFDLVKSQLGQVQGQRVKPIAVISSLPHHQEVGELCITDTDTDTDTIMTQHIIIPNKM